MKQCFLTLCLCVGACQAAAFDTPSVDGIWETDGYGMILEIAGDRARVYSTGPDFCIAESDGMTPITEVLPGITFTLSGHGQMLNLAFWHDPHRIAARRLHGLPPSCAVHMPTDPATVFDAFVGYFDAHYPFFPLYDVDWSARVAEARTLVGADTSDRALFDVLAWLISPIRDSHVSLVAEIDGVRHVAAPGRARIVQHLRDDADAAGADPDRAAHAFRDALWYDSIQKDILQGRGQMIGQDRIQYGMLTRDIGYLAFATLGGFDPADDLQMAQILLDEIIAYFTARRASTLLLDLSVNSGGSDIVAREVARRFVRTPTFAYTKRAADAARPIETRVVIDPNTDARFNGAVIVLTSHVTVSAAEILTLALRPQPHVTHVGETTRGALSDAVSRSLPNGWQLSLSNELYLDADGHRWEGRGIPPHVALPVLTDETPIESHRQVIEVLRGNTP
ncbi:S41 family peptidase [uncultured Tateyamaria sp.]|uniref:S41 family peptidase n=1 Tax=Tateyamaria sp. 1078 TaxID=3417464 RepID=UPI00262F919E|nr:S41 family peptidase [uncultured Tateyamaria sp.]